MATVVQSLGTLWTLNMDLWPRSEPGAVTMYDNFTYDYATLYEKQPNVRLCVDFIARNIAQLGLHVYRRVSDTDRQRLTKHGMARTIRRPNPFTTRYRLVNTTISDLCVYDNAYWLKLPAKTGEVALLGVPPAWVSIRGSAFNPTLYEVNLGTSTLKVEPSAMVHFRGYNPKSKLRGLSPLETLRRTLAEEWAAGEWREGFWKHSAKQSLIVERPAGAPEWSDKAQKEWRANFEALYAGGPGRTMVLEEGMTAKMISFDPQQAQYLEGRKLTKIEVATQYFIQASMVNILDNANFANITEQHKMLYQDTLAPTCVMVEEEIDLQLLPEYDDAEDVYCEFNIEEKLKGSFEEQAKSFQMLVGRPVMTADEARARLNLPSMGGGAAKLITPLNVLIGGQASPRDSAPNKSLAGVVQRFAKRQQAVVESKGGSFDVARWNRELAADLEGLIDDPASLAADLNGWIGDRIGEMGPKAAYDALQQALLEIGG